MTVANSKSLHLKTPDAYFTVQGHSSTSRLLKNFKFVPSDGDSDEERGVNFSKIDDGVAKVTKVDGVAKDARKVDDAVDDAKMFDDFKFFLGLHKEWNIGGKNLDDVPAMLKADKVTPEQVTLITQSYERYQKFHQSSSGKALASHVDGTSTGRKWEALNTYNKQVFVSSPLSNIVQFKSVPLIGGKVLGPFQLLLYPRPLRPNP
ncbi:unnamed protein product [Phytophthora lilii]|uniref:Unnamed protein product n=1 Tax=Phytophthora lilii TaxID=2077276 RepID=A0A9W6U8W3_9STRA|nr:unnamed protein product [Phytophthora lilii]